MARCRVHNVETLLRCARCGEPICPDCAIPGPAGFLCYACARPQWATLRGLQSGRFLLAGLAGLAAACVGGFCLGLFYRLGFLLLWIGLFDGLIVAAVMLRLAGNLRGPAVEATAVAVVVAGFVVGISAYFVYRGLPPQPAAVAGFLTRQFFLLVGLGMAAFGAYSRVRYG